MREENHAVSLLHGKDMEVEERDRILEEFRKGTTKVLITTNVLARGIDVPQVSLVVNFDIPLDAEKHPDPETYVHRIGRAGRFGRRGIAINLVHDRFSEAAMKYIEKWQNRPIEEAPSDIEECEKFFKKQF